jgi:hypothetical protein
MAKNTEKMIYRWWVYHMKGTPAEYIGSVDAPDEEAAREVAIVEFGVSKEKHDRLLAVKIAVLLEDA